MVVLDGKVHLTLSLYFYRINVTNFLKYFTALKNLPSKEILIHCMCKLCKN